MHQTKEKGDRTDGTAKFKGQPSEKLKPTERGGENREQNPHTASSGERFKIAVLEQEWANERRHQGKNGS